MKNLTINGVTIKVSDTEYNKYQKAIKEQKKTTYSMPVEEPTKSATVTKSDKVRFYESKGAKIELLADGYTVMSGKTNGFVVVETKIPSMRNGLKMSAKAFKGQWSGTIDKKHEYNTVLTWTFPNKEYMKAFIVYQQNRKSVPKGANEDEKAEIYKYNDELKNDILSKIK